VEACQASCEVLGCDVCKSTREGEGTCWKRKESGKGRFVFGTGQGLPFSFFPFSPTCLLSADTDDLLSFQSIRQALDTVTGTNSNKNDSASILAARIAALVQVARHDPAAFESESERLVNVLVKKVILSGVVSIFILSY